MQDYLLIFVLDQLYSVSYSLFEASMLNKNLFLFLDEDKAKNGKESV